MTTLTLDRQAFDSDVLGFTVARLAPARALDARVLATETAIWRRAGIGLVVCRVPEDWTATRAALEAAGFRAIETLVTFERGPLAPPAVPGFVRPARLDDRDACVAIAGRAFRFDRYHADPRVPDDAADRLKARWAANAFAGRAEAILVADEGGGALGFAFCMKRDGAGFLDLIAVAPEAQGHGLGAALLAGFIARYAGLRTRAGTQANNNASCRMYERAGYAAIARDVTFHWMPGR